MSELELIPRRSFLKGAAALGLGMLAAEEIRAADSAPADDAPKGPPVNCGIIGLGKQGRDILGQLNRLASAQTVAICDKYEPFINRAKPNAPKAQTYTDYKKLLEQPDVQAVFVVTPSHQHKQIALDALQAGKHVYCEAPLAITLEEARAIAQAGKASKQKFAAGLQLRTNPIHNHAFTFMKSGVLSHVAEGTGQWRKKTSWRTAAPTPERQKELNWRLDKETSCGLMGEIGMHQADVANRFFKALPTAVTGFGSLMHWDDGRDVPDTVNCVFEYPNKLRFLYDATLVSSTGESFEQFMGSDGTMLMKGLRAWMFKEIDSPLLGWEVYAHSEKVGDDLGIILVADATKILAAGKDPAQTVTDLGKPPLYYALEDFVTSIQQDKAPQSGPIEGFQATVTGIKAHEAVMSGSRVAFQKEWFDLS
jgi:predicted dehydrogenase